MGDPVSRDYVDGRLAEMRSDMLGHWRLDDQRFAAAKEAVDKALTATEKRFEGVNEWRDQSADRERSHATERAVTYASFVPREVWDTQHRSVIDQIGQMQSRLDVMAGERAGTQHLRHDSRMNLTLWIMLAGVIIATATVVAIILTAHS